MKNERNVIPRDYIENTNSSKMNFINVSLKALNISAITINYH